ncbi:DUF484 family protein [Methylocaldum sp.]|uniref:DUF484 family protein n=1 Tax=Methylocaldum sp. TaxID=1969727 RepID=UPI002D5F1DF5|nr:DUF484 family protein [Methylocaldum sp.]HYE34352.1 DUF484 family protein [Methylocaldum sp.]
MSLITPKTPKRHEEKTVSAVEVEVYLRQHPDFFHNQLDLLEILKVPHPCGEAVSLISRQISLLRDNNRQLQAQLNDILQIARDNDALHQRIHQLTLTLLDATTLEDALGGLTWGLHEYFQADFITVKIMQPAIASPIADLYMPSDDAGLILFASVLEAGKPHCGKPHPDQAKYVFGDDASEVLSYALIPLQHAGFKGLLAIGSRNASRFEAGMGLHFLGQLGEIVSARFASLLTRLT